MGPTHPPPLGLAFLLVCLLGLCPSLSDARCGYPELPFKSQLMPANQFESVGYFEEGQRVKVICENGLVGHGHSNKTGYLAVDSSATIVCGPSARWNTTGLQCLQKVELDSRHVQVKWKELEAARNVESLVDHDAQSCLDLDLAKASDDSAERVLLSLRLESENARIPRVVLMLKNTDQVPHNATLLEDLIEGIKSTNATEAPADAGDVEVEESKRFLDFVYQTEFANHSGAVKMMMLANEQEDGSVDRLQKVIRTGQHEVKVSVALGIATERRACILNEDAAIAVGSKGAPQQATELLIFDCHLEEGDKASLVWVQLDISKLNDRNASSGETSVSSEAAKREVLQLCGLEAFALAHADCGRPYVPVYGVVSKTRAGADNLTTAAQYGCVSGYRAINLTTEHEHELPSPGAKTPSAPLQRTCDRATGKWTPAAEDIFCVPLASCRHPPPLPDPKKFYFEYGKLDNLKRAIAGASTATLRCQMLTDYVMPYTIYGCDKSGAWVRMGRNDTAVPECRTSLTRYGRGGRRSNHYYHHYYHYYDNQPTNRTSVIIFGRQINDNKYLIYYGAAGLVVLFGGSFIILFHVRRMAKKISRQMRERSYMAAEKGISDSFLPVSGVEGQLPPYYNNDGNFYDVNTMFSNDLPPPATPISMPTSGLEKDHNNKSSNLSAGFDSIKF